VVDLVGRPARWAAGEITILLQELCQFLPVMRRWPKSLMLRCFFWLGRRSTRSGMGRGVAPASVGRPGCC